MVYVVLSLICNANADNIASLATGVHGSGVTKVCSSLWTDVLSLVASFLANMKYVDFIQFQHRLLHKKLILQNFFVPAIHAFCASNLFVLRPARLANTDRASQASTG